MNKKTKPKIKRTQGVVLEADLFHFMFNHVRDELMLIKEGGRIAYLNDAVVSGLGFSRKYLKATPIYRLFKEKISLDLWRKWYVTPLKKARKPISYQIQRLNKRKEMQTIHVTAVYVVYQGCGYILSIGHDVTKQLSMQARLKESQDLYRLLTEGARDGIFMTDMKGNITYANKSLEKLAKVPLRISQGTSFVHYVSKNTLPKAIACFKKAKQGVAQIRDDIEIIDKKGTIIPVEINVSPIYKNGKIINIHAIVRDIRSRRKIEQIQSESEKMQALQLFLSGTTQELEFPLGVIKDLTEEILQRFCHRNFEYISFKEFTDIMKTIEKINKRVCYCCDTTQRLVNLSQKRIGLKKGQCSVNEAIHEALKMKNYQLHLDDIRCTLRLKKDIPNAAIGKVEFAQVIDNLINNAIQALTEGESFSIKTAYHKSHGLVEVEVKDEGVGISKEDLGHIFEPFFTTKQRGEEKNSGLGLSIVYKIIKSCQGEINVKSSMREGTTVTLLIPAVKTS